jgi:hypothetical protein
VGNLAGDFAVERDLNEGAADIGKPHAGDTQARIRLAHTTDLPLGKEHHIGGTLMILVAAILEGISQVIEVEIFAAALVGTIQERAMISSIRHVNLQPIDTRFIGPRFGRT